MVNNTSYGIDALKNNLGINNSAFGAYASYNNTDSSNNTSVGSNSAFFNTTGSNNTSLGAGSLCNNTTGSLNTAIGSSALEGISGQSVGNQNTAVGVQALYSNSGIQNTAIGAYAALGVTDGDYNTFLGTNTTFDILSQNYQYSTAIGYGAEITQDNQIIMGGNSSGQYPDVTIPGNAYLPNFNASNSTNDQIVTKNYVDTFVTGLKIQPPVKCISTFDNSANTGIDTGNNFINIYPVPIFPQDVSSGFIIDNYTVQPGDPVLLNDQGTPSTSNAINNGVYDLSYNGTIYYFIRSTTELYIGYNAVGAYIKSTNTNGTDGESGWVQGYRNTNNEAIVGTDPLLFFPFNPSGTGYLPGIGLYTTQEGKNLYLNVDSSLNFLTNIDASGGGTLDVGTQSSTLNLGSIDTSVNIAGNSYVYTPFSLGSTFSPQTLNITSTSNSTQIIFNWTIPSLNNSISSSFQNISATLYANISGSIYTYPILSDISLNISSLNTIILTNQSSSNGFINGTTYNYFSSDFLNMQDSSYNQLILWYSNYSPYPNVSYAGYTSFQSIGVPSPVVISLPSDLPSDTQATVDSNFAVTDGSVTLNCLVTYVNDINPSAPAPPNIVQYQSPTGYYTTSGSSSRYLEPYINPQTSKSVGCNTAENVNTPFTFTNMYPDSSYYFSVQAKNITNPTYGPFNDPSFNYSTPPPSYPTSTFLVPTPLFNSSGKKYTYLSPSYFFVGTTTQVNNDIINSNNISSGFVSNNIITAVQTNGTYGNNSLDSSLNATASLNSISTPIQVKSFGFGPNFTSNSGGITVTSTTFDAYYKGNPYNQGFYLDCSTNMTISNSYAFGIPTSTLFTATLSLTGNGINPSSNYSFYIDDLSSIPIYAGITGFTINSSNNYYSNQVSGIWVLNTSKNPVFSVTNLQLSNMGDYFYANPLVTYNITNGVSGSQSETNTNNVTNISGGKFQNTIDISNNNISGTSNTNTVSSSYTKLISLNIIFNNLFGSVTQNNIANINVICDQPSYNLITNVLATSIQTLGFSSPGVNGYRVWSANVDSGIPGGGTMSPSGYVPYVYIVNGTSIPNNTATGFDPYSGLTEGYVNIQYNNIWDISGNLNTNQEMLIASGGFTTNNSFYLNYSSSTVSSANGNTVNYTGLSGTGNSGLKYATFAWNSSGGTGLPNINFVLTFDSPLFLNPNSLYFFDNTFLNPLYLFYRFEYNIFTGGNQSDGTYWGQIPSTTSYYPNTTWIACNSITGTQYGTTSDVTNYNNRTIIYYSTANNTPNGTSYTFTALSPSAINFSNSTLYLRVGFPNSVTQKLTNITAYFS